MSQERPPPGLIPTSALGLKTLMFTARGPGAPAKMRFDPELDMLDVVLGVVRADDVIVVHYLEDEPNVALLYREADGDIVGIHIEYFIHGFLGR